MRTAMADSARSGALPASATDGECMPALMYHDVVADGMEDSSGFPGRDAARYKVTPTQFFSHLEAISRSAGAGSAVMTFDDGGVSALQAADTLDATTFVDTS